MTNIKWKIKENKLNENKLGFSIDIDILKILETRGIESREDVLNFLNPKIESLQNPSDLEDLDKAVEKIRFSIENQKNIFIYGDYDVDGITSTSILYLALKELGLKNIHFYIPKRTEGYGLNTSAIEYIKSQNCDLIITVDCGINSFEEISFANSIGLDVIVTDHHTLSDLGIPNAYAVVNPKRKENKYTFSELAGVGTIFMLISKLYETYNKKEDALKFIDLVAIGTIADIVPLIKENRILAKYGLIALKNSKNLGLSKLINVLFKDKTNDYEFTSKDVGFSIAPTFNAVGRLYDAKMVVELLISENENEIDSIIEELINKNFERKILQNNISEMVLKNIEENHINDEYIIIDHSKDYHHGVMGIVAAKIVDKFLKPTIIMEENEQTGIAVGSCRSIESFNLMDALNHVSHLLVKFGGHSGAAGFSIEIKNIETFKNELFKYAKEKLKKDDFYKVIEIDKDLTIQKISYEFFQVIDELKPFGFGNPIPTFLTRNVNIKNCTLIGKNKNHMKFEIQKDDFIIKNSVWFNSSDYFNSIDSNSLYDIVYKINVDEFLGKYYTKAMIEDIKPSKENFNNFDYYDSLYNTSFPMKSVFYSQNSININNNIELNESYGKFSLVQGKSFIGYLDNNTSTLLSKLKSLYNWSFNVKITDIKDYENHKIVNILIDREYNLLDYSIDDKKTFINIKNFLLKDLEYSSTTKLALSNLFKNDKSVIINNNNIKVISHDDAPNIKIDMNYYLNLILNFGMFHYIKNNRKIDLYTKDSILLNNKLINNYFNIYDNIKKLEKKSISIYDFNTIDYIYDIKNINEKSLIFDDKFNYDVKTFEVLKNTITINKNIFQFKKSLLNDLKNDNILLKCMPNSKKKEILDLMKNNKTIFSDEGIIEFI